MDKVQREDNAIILKFKWHIGELTLFQVLMYLYSIRPHTF